MQVRFLSCCVNNVVVLHSFVFVLMISPAYSQGVLTFNTCSATENTPPNVPPASSASSDCGFLDAFVLPAFTRWDSAQFLNIAIRMGNVTPGPGHAWDGYYSEASHAFLPLFPLLVRLLVGTTPLLQQAFVCFHIICRSPFCAGRIRLTATDRIGRDSSTGLRHRSCCFVESVR